MTHPFVKIPLKKRKAVFLAALMATLALMIILGVLGEPLKEKDLSKHPQELVVPNGIISYEFAETPEQAQKMIEFWQTAGLRQKAINHFFIDYLYLIAYPMSIGMSCVGIAFLLRDKACKRLTSLGLWLSWGQVVAGLCDAIENALLLTMLWQVSANASMPISRIFTIIKFALVIAGLLYVYTGAIILSVQKFAEKRE